jgi:hypothetical protein
LLRLDGRLDREVLRLLAHQDRSSRHGKYNAKKDSRCNPQPWFRLGDVDPRRDRSLDLRIRPDSQAGAVHLGRHFGRVGGVRRFVATGHNNRRRP